MQFAEKKCISTLSSLNKVNFINISSVSFALFKFLKVFSSKNNSIFKVLPDRPVIYSFNSKIFSKKHLRGSGLFAKLIKQVLNTATVYIHGSNHNLVYAASAYRLHPGPTLYMQKHFVEQRGPVTNYPAPKNTDLNNTTIN
jgi:hypothetical protein